jgi:hypothetical protein
MMFHSSCLCDRGRKAHIGRSPEMVQLEGTGYFKDSHCPSGGLIILLSYSTWSSAPVLMLGQDRFGNLERNFSMAVYRPDVADWNTEGRSNSDETHSSATLWYFVYVHHLRCCSGLKIWESILCIWSAAECPMFFCALNNTLDPLRLVFCRCLNSSLVGYITTPCIASNHSVKCKVALLSKYYPMKTYWGMDV